MQHSCFITIITISMKGSSSKRSARIVYLRKYFLIKINFEGYWIKLFVFFTEGIPKDRCANCNLICKHFLSYSVLQWLPVCEGAL